MPRKRYRSEEIIHKHPEASQSFERMRAGREAKTVARAV